MLSIAGEELHRLRAEGAAHYAQLRSENQELREANARLARDLSDARWAMHEAPSPPRLAERAGGAAPGESAYSAASSSSDARLVEALAAREHTVTLLEEQLARLQSELAAQREDVQATLDERSLAVDALEGQLGAVQQQLLSVLQTQLQQRDDVRKLTATGGPLYAPPLSAEEAEPALLDLGALRLRRRPATMPLPAPACAARLLGSVDQLIFSSEVAEWRETLSRRLHAPRRSIAQEFASNEGGMWLAEYEYVTQQPCREVRHRRAEWWVGAPAVGGGFADAPVVSEEDDTVVRDEGHDGWTLDDFCARALVRAAGLTRAEVAMLRLWTGPCHAPLQFFLRHDGAEVLSCPNCEPYFAHYDTGHSPLAFVYAVDVAHRTSTGAERCARCRRPRREHTREPLHDWSTSAAVLCSAVDKLAMWSPPVVAYRPVREDGGALAAGAGTGALPPSFAPREGGGGGALGRTIAGAVPGVWRGVACADRGLLSATTDRQLALALSGGRTATASVLQIGFDYAARGADLHWVSQYPAEKEVLFAPATSLLPQSVREWTERRRVVSVVAAPASIRTLAHLVTSLAAEPSGAAHALAARVSQSVSGLGEGVSASVSRLWSGVEHTATLAHIMSSGGGGGYANSPSSPVRELVVGGAASPTRRASPPRNSSPPRNALQQELASALADQRSRVAAREQVVERVHDERHDERHNERRPGGARASAWGYGAREGISSSRAGSWAAPQAPHAPHAPLAPNLFEFERGRASSRAPTIEHRRAVLTINDALETLSKVSAFEPPSAYARSKAASHVHAHLEIAEAHLARAAATTAAAAARTAADGDASRAHKSTSGGTTQPRRKKYRRAAGQMV